MEALPSPSTEPRPPRPLNQALSGFAGIVVDRLAPYELTTLVQPAADKGRAAGMAVAAMLDKRPPRFTGN